MKIERLEVNGGFLDGLKLPFTDGLNVLIGARGAGKTSIVELIRYGLGVPAMTTDVLEAGADLRDDRDVEVAVRQIRAHGDLHGLMCW